MSCFFKFNLQQLIQFLKVLFDIPPILGAVSALNLSSALFRSSRVKSSKHRTMQELRSYLWNYSTSGNKLRTMYLTQSRIHETHATLLLLPKQTLCRSPDSPRSHNQGCTQGSRPYLMHPGTR